MASGSASAIVETLTAVEVRVATTVHAGTYAQARSINAAAFTSQVLEGNETLYGFDLFADDEVIVGRSAIMGVSYPDCTCARQATNASAMPSPHYLWCATMIRRCWPSADDEHTTLGRNGYTRLPADRLACAVANGSLLSDGTNKPTLSWCLNECKLKTHCSPSMIDCVASNARAAKNCNDHGC